MNSGSATDTSKLDAYLVKKKRCGQGMQVFFSESIPIVSVGNVLHVSCLQSPTALLLKHIIISIADSSLATIYAARVAHAERRSSIPGLSPLRWWIKETEKYYHK